MREVAQALHHAYWSTDMSGKRLAVVHRDVSPHNVILSYDGAVKLLDFGVAMSAVTEQAQSMIVGKWLYMSPEHTTNQQLDHRSDLFSLGVILYLLCSGSMPFIGDRTQGDRQEDPRRPVQAAPGASRRTSGAAGALVARLLAPNPDDRPQPGQEVVAELTEIARTTGSRARAPTSPASSRSCSPTSLPPSPRTMGSASRSSAHTSTPRRSARR